MSKNAEAGSQKSSFNHTTTDLDDSSRMHGDQIVGLLGQLVQGHSCALVNCFVF